MINLVVSSIKISYYKYIVLSIQKEANFEAKKRCWPDGTILEL